MADKLFRFLFFISVVLAVHYNFSDSFMTFDKFKQQYYFNENRSSHDFFALKTFRNTATGWHAVVMHLNDLKSTFQDQIVFIDSQVNTSFFNCNHILKYGQATQCTIQDKLAIERPTEVTSLNIPQEISGYEKLVTNCKGIKNNMIKVLHSSQEVMIYCE